MAKEKQQKASKNQSQHRQQSASQDTELLFQQRIGSGQTNSIGQRISRISNIPSIAAHAGMLNGASAKQQSANRQLLLQLQRQHGNRYVQQVVQAGQQNQPVIQTKLTLGAVGDKYEQEADRVAKQVVNSISSTNQEPVQRMKPEDEELAQMKPDIQRMAVGEATEVDPSVEDAIQRGRGRGQPLAPSVRVSMEQAFGADFSGVRVHTDSQSHQLNQSIQARAFTTGQDVFFQQGEYNPGSLGGKELLAHELTHVVQQSGGAVQRSQSQDGENVLSLSPQMQNGAKMGHAQDIRASEVEQENNSGMPDNLKAGIDSISGILADTDIIQPKLIQGEGEGQVSNVMVQADYMSGDRYTIATALKLNPKLGIIIIGYQNAIETANELRSFYQSSAGAVDRVKVLEVAHETRVKSAYKQISKRSITSKWLKHDLNKVYKGNNKDLKTASFGTKVVAEVYELQEKQKLTEKVRNQWKSSYENELEKYLSEKGFDKGKKYLFLWVKEGDRTAEKAHHFTSILTWRKLKDKAEKKGYIPVAVGDDIGLRTKPSLVKYWEDWDKDEKFASFKSEGRKAQLGMWKYIAETWGIKVASIGMRSGALEVPALLGIKTIYLEEAGNQQAKRMEQWIDKVPTWKRHIISKPPGLKQLIYWKDSIKKYDDSTEKARETHKHLIEQLDNLVLPSNIPLQGSNLLGLAESSDDFAEFKLFQAPIEPAIMERQFLLMKQIKSAQITPETYGVPDTELDQIITQLD